jgi:hypothetical protein
VRVAAGSRPEDGTAVLEPVRLTVVTEGGEIVLSKLGIRDFSVGRSRTSAATEVAAGHPPVSGCSFVAM